MFFTIPELRLFADEDRGNNRITELYRGVMESVVSGIKVIAYDPRPESGKKPCARIDIPEHGYSKTFVGENVTHAFLLALADAQQQAS